MFLQSRGLEEVDVTVVGGKEEPLELVLQIEDGGEVENHWEELIELVFGLLHASVGVDRLIVVALGALVEDSFGGFVFEENLGLVVAFLRNLQV